MSVLKDLGTKRFWLSVALSIVVVLSVCAVGAYAVVLGVSDPQSAWVWVCFAWLFGVLAGGRCASAGKENALLRVLTTAVITVGILWGFGLTMAGIMGESMPWWWTLAAVLIGALLAVMLPNRKGKGGKKKGKTALRATRGR